MATSFLATSLGGDVRGDALSNLVRRFVSLAVGLCVLAGTAAASAGGGGGSIIGSVDVPGQTDFSGTSVLLTGTRTMGGLQVSLSDVTDSTGVYGFTEIYGGTYNLLISRAGYVSQSVRGIILEETEDKSLDFTLVAFASLSGAVLVDRALPAPAGVSVTLTGPSGPLTTATDAAGLFAFDTLLPGDYTVTVSRDCAQPVSQPVTLPASSFVTVRSPSNNFRVSGVVSLAGLAGGDASDTTVALSADVGGAASTVRTDPVGGYAFAGLCGGNYTLTASRQYFASKTLSLAVNAITVAPALSLDLAATFKVSGTVSVGGGGDASGVLVRLEGTTLKATSAADGAFEVAGVTPAIYTLVASRTGLADVVIPNVAIAADYKVTLHMTAPLPIVRQRARCSAADGTVAMFPLLAVMGLLAALRLRRRLRAR